MAFGQGTLDRDKLAQLDAETWELYDIHNDLTENTNVAAGNKHRLQELVTLWYAEAGKYKVLPIDGRGQSRFADPRPQIAAERSRFTYYPGTQSIPNNAAVNIINRPHTITANLTVPEGGANGVIVAQGGNDGGFAVYVKDTKLKWAHNYVAQEIFHVESTTELPSGDVVVEVQFEVTGPPDIKAGKGTPGRVRLAINGVDAGEGEVPYTVPLTFSLGGGITVGRDEGSSVSPDYGTGNAFTGTVRQVIFDVSGEQTHDPEAHMRAVMAHQ